MVTVSLIKMTDGSSNQFKQLTEREIQLQSKRITWSSKLANQKTNLAQSWRVKATLFTSITAEKKRFWKYLINQPCARALVRAINVPQWPKLHTSHTQVSPLLRYLAINTHIHTLVPAVCLFHGDFHHLLGDQAERILSVQHSLSLNRWDTFKLQHTLEWPWGSIEASRWTVKYLHTHATIPLLSGDRTLKHNSLFAS